MIMSDTELATALKQARMRKMFFAIIFKGTDAKLIVSRRKIEPREIDKAKKEIGGGTLVKGMCFGAFSVMMFQVDEAPPAMLAATLQKVIKRDAGLDIVVRVKMVDLNSEDEL